MPRWDTEAKAAAAHWGPYYGTHVDPALVHAVIERESRHGADPRYIAFRGIVPEPGGRRSAGPMMVLEDTLRRYNATLQLEALALSPAVGIWYGTRELARLLSVFPGDTARALAAYNAGQGNASRNAQGKFYNQAYVDAVLGFWRGYRGAVISLVPVLLAGGALYLWSRRRAA